MAARVHNIGGGGGVVGCSQSQLSRGRVLGVKRLDGRERFMGQNSLGGGGGGSKEEGGFMGHNSEGKGVSISGLTKIEVDGSEGHNSGKGRGSSATNRGGGGAKGSQTRGKGWGSQLMEEERFEGSLT